jgi:glutaredoxin 3
LDHLKVNYKVFELDEMDDGADIQDALLDMTGQRSVPNVFIKGEHLGGNDDVQSAFRDGSLELKLGLAK